MKWALILLALAACKRDREPPAPDAAVFRDRYAQPICLTDYRQTTPAFTTPVKGLYLTDSCQLHPHDRSISGSFGLGRQAAEQALAALGTTPARG